MLKRSSPRNCKMTFIVDRGFAERQILKKWKLLYLLNWLVYFDKLWRKHWYWQDLAQKIANWHFYRSRLCRAPNSEKCENSPISRTVRNIVMKFCIHIDIDKMYPMNLSNDIWDRSRFCQCSNSGKSETGPIPWTFWYILIKFCIPITIDMI